MQRLGNGDSSTAQIITAPDKITCQHWITLLNQQPLTVLPSTHMQKDADTPRATGIDRRSFLKSAAAGTAAFATGVSLLSWARPGRAAGSLADVQADAAKAAKQLANGRVITLRILQPSGSLGNIKPVAQK